MSASGASTYTWTGGLAAGASTSAGPLTTTTTYTVTGTASGCTGKAVATVRVNANPVVSVNSPAICTGQSANLSASGATTYTWTGGLAAGATTSAGPLTTTTTYTVTGTASSCTGTAVSTVTVNPVPITGSITQSNDTLYSSSVLASASYEWYLGSSSVPTATTSTPYLKITVGGSYTLKIVQGGCSSAASAPFSATLVGIRNSTNSVKVFEVYPNPTEGRLVMNLNLTKNASVQIRIYTPEGRELYTKGFANTRNVFEEVSMSEYAKGVYIIKLNVDDETYYHKVVKQ